MVDGVLAFPADPCYELERRLAKRAPLYPLVPKGFVENLDFRKRMIEWGSESPEHAHTLWIASRRDLLFWVNTFVWTHDPRKLATPVLPFNTYRFQDGAFLRMAWCLGRCDLWGEKSRTMGWTWMLMTLFLHRWQFFNGQSFLVTSRKEDLVDKAGNTDTLFAKLDFALAHEPGWLVPRFTRTHLHFGNDDNQSAIDGDSNTGDLARGGRRTATGHDEFATGGGGWEVLAATGDVADSRFFGSTPKPSGAFKDHITRSDILKLTLHWRQHPEKSKGLYHSARNGKLEILDTGYEFPPDYPFVLDGRLRSIAYDKQCNRRHNMREMAQEWDIEYIGSGFQYFDAQEIKGLMDGPKATARPPLAVGHLEFDTELGRNVIPRNFAPKPGGFLRLWTPLDERGKPPTNTRYVVGADVSAGTGASNSAASVLDCLSGQKVAELVTPNLSPEDFALHVVALCRWFVGHDGEPAMLCWEANGPGRQFEKKVLQVGFRHIWFERPDRKLSPKITDKPGWFSTDPTKLIVLGAYREALGNGVFLNPSVEALEETLHYNYLPDGTVAHADSVTCPDPSGARENHGDRVIADAVAFMIRTKSQAGQQREEEVFIPEGLTMKSRRELALRKRRPCGWREHGQDRWLRLAGVA